MGCHMEGEMLISALLAMHRKLFVMVGPVTSVVSSTVVTVRGLSPELKSRLRIRAAHNARSMEAEARSILEQALAKPEEDPTDLATFARSLFGPLGGADLELPFRELVPEPPSLFELEAAGTSTKGTPSLPMSKAGAGRTATTARGERKRSGKPRP